MHILKFNGKEQSIQAWADALGMTYNTIYHRYVDMAWPIEKVLSVPYMTRHNCCKKDKHTPEYTSWIKMRERCRDPNHDAYKHYGGRGIKVCDRWAHDFKNFLADMGPKPSSGHSLDRIDNDGDYTPENCRWATKSEQQRNKINNHLLTYNNETKTMMEWSEIKKINYFVLVARINRGWSVEKSLTTPIGKRGTKLNREQVDLIRQLYADGGVTQQCLAECFDISQGQVNYIIRGLHCSMRQDKVNEKVAL